MSLLLVSCQTRNLAKELEAFSKVSISFPEDMLKIENGQKSPAGEIASIPTLVLYHDSLSCSNCVIAHLYEKSKLYDYADSLRRFQIITIFSPKESEIKKVIKDVELKGFSWPVYVDRSCSFIERNKHIPKDKRFHSFFTDETGKPIFVGDPTANGNLWELFEKAIEQIFFNESNVYY